MLMAGSSGVAPVFRAEPRRSGAGGHRRVVPEVTFCRRGLAPACWQGQAGAMKDSLKTLLSPLNFAAYVAWGAIGWELMFTRWKPPAGLGMVVPGALLVAMQFGFLLLFMAVSSGPWG